MQNRCCAAVSAIDSILLNISTSANTITLNEFLLVGYVTGEIALFDATSGSIIKRIMDIHTSRVVKLQITQQFINNLNTTCVSSSTHPFTKTKDTNVEIYAISIDTKGVVHRLHLVKVQTNSLLSNWGSSSSHSINFTASSDCLLDGGAGVITELAVCPPLRHYTSNSIKNSSNVMTLCPSNFQIVSFNSLSRTYFVQVNPIIKIVHRSVVPTIVKDQITACQDMNPLMRNQNNNTNVAPIVSLEWGWVHHKNVHQFIKADIFNDVINNCTNLHKF